MDLTCLLTTGRTSEGVLDYLGSGEHMSERVGHTPTIRSGGCFPLTDFVQSIQKWETTMVEALTRLRDFSEKRVAPACQRLRLLLQEVQGWAALWVALLTRISTLHLSRTQTPICGMQFHRGRDRLLFGHDGQSDCQLRLACCDCAQGADSVQGIHEVAEIWYVSYVLLCDPARWQLLM